MIANDQQLEMTLERIAWVQKQVSCLRKTETNPVNYMKAVSGFLSEVETMQLEVLQYLSFLPSEGSEEQLSRSSQTQNLESEFARLAREWRDATGGQSTTSHMVSHPAYLQIIAKGPRVVPLILKELEREPANWFAALKVLTQEDPVPNEARGNKLESQRSLVGIRPQNGIHLENA